MKKYILSIAAFALALSCTKETPVENELTLGEGIPVTVVVGSPEYGGDNEEVKITQSLNGNGYSYTWNAGDAFRLVAYAPIKDNGESTRTDCGDFVTAAGGKEATFVGTIPADTPETYTEYWAVAPAPKEGDKFEIAQKSTSTSSFRYLITMDIAETQDGTGFKYAHFCAISTTKSKLSKDTESGAWSFTDAPSFKMAEAMLHLGLEETHEITKIEVSYELYDSKGQKKTALAGETFYATNSTGTNSSKTSLFPSKVLTVYDDGKVLPKDVFIAVRHQPAGADYGTDKSKLHFTFYKADGSYVKKSLAIKKTEKGVKSYSTLSSGNVYNIGTLDTSKWGFYQPKLEIVWNAGDAFTAPSGAGYTEFPSAVLLSGILYATLDGDGKLLDRYTFQDKKTYFDLGNISAGVYMAKENLQAKLGTDYLFEDRDYLFKGYTFKFGRYYALSPSGYNTKDTGKIRLIPGCIGFPAIEGKRLTHVTVQMNVADISKDGKNANAIVLISAERQAATGSDSPAAYKNGGTIPTGRAAYVLKSNGKLVATDDEIAASGTDMNLYESYAVGDFALTKTEVNTIYYFVTQSLPIVSKIVLTYDDPE